ncbi:MAG: hypothetical protein F7C34_04165 [Desulfurococcales archaeon]|nr:hypothetical protein [Desulfurococcales archaeon]
MNPIARAADRCAQTLMEIYRGLKLLHDAEWGDLVSMGEGPGPVQVFVKSVREASIDEIPLILALLEGLRSRRVEFFEYERMTRGEMSREEVLARLINSGLRRGNPTIVVMPSALPASLYSRLPWEAREALSRSLAIRVIVENENILYLPEQSPRDGVEIVAKNNSASSYARVRWLRGEAERRNIRVRGEVYLQDNASIMEYVLEKGIQSIGERIPVNKLAHYIVALSKCDRISGIEQLRRWERSTHLVYAINTSIDTLLPVYEMLRGRRMRLVDEILVGPLYSEIMAGARRIMREVLARLLESLF